jgi:hypothetical protein
MNTPPSLWGKTREQRFTPVDASSLVLFRTGFARVLLWEVGLTKGVRSLLRFL